MFDVDLNMIGQAVVIVGAIAGVWYRLHMRITENARALDAFKIEVAREYATLKHMTAVETRLASSIDRLSDRIDKLLEQLRKG